MGSLPYTLFLKILQVTEKLSDVAVHPSMATEVRIAAYLGAIRCAEEEHLDKIVSRISEEKNTQGNTLCNRYSYPKVME